VEQTLPDRVDVVVVGGGFAGAATACFLARRGITDILVLEAADQFGAAASGLNASMIRQVATDPVTGALLRASANQIRHGDWADPVDARWNGSLLLTEGERGLPVLDAARAAATAGLDCRIVDRDQATARVPLLAAAHFDRAIWTPGDGVIDISALLWRYLRAAKRGGARLVTGCPVTGVEVEAGRVAAVRTPQGRTACRVLVDAAGAWAGEIATLAGLAPLPLTPFRRHLVVTPPQPWVDTSWPLTWHLTDDWYFRPEVGGLMLSPCDQTPCPAGPTPRDPAVLELLAERLAARCPPLANLPIQTWWAGLRTLAADGRFVVGPDPRLSGFFWVAGLGGHGMTGSASVGELAAALVAGGTVDADIARAVEPGRFLAG
jgi:glycine/D-amino acid oxidase-like deaminating enzyme